MWNFDGVACAAALELGNPTYFFHANHLLYGFLGYGFWKIIGIPCGLTRALPALQLFTSLLAALGLIGLFQLIRASLKSSVSALLLTMGLSVTAAFWVWSVEAQVYTLGFFPLAWATYLLIEYKGANKYLAVGLLHAAAVLGHLMHFLWAIPALYWMWGQSKDIRHYLTVLFLGTVIPYAWVLAAVIMPRHDWPHTLIWLKGSAGLTPDRSWAWHFPGKTGPWQWLMSTLPELWGNFWPYGGVPISKVPWALAICSIVLVVTLLIRSWEHRQEKVWRFSWIWLGVYGLFLSTWEPTTLCYRLPDVIPLGILLALGLGSFRVSAKIVLASLWLGSTFTVNWMSRIAPMHEIQRNSVYQDTLTLSKITPPSSLYITTGGPTWLYLLYFTGRTAWNANDFTPDQLKDAIKREKRVRPIYMLKGSSWQKVS
jgi:hypothetical protein